MLISLLFFSAGDLAVVTVISASSADSYSVSVSVSVSPSELDIQFVRGPIIIQSKRTVEGWGEEAPLPPM